MLFERVLIWIDALALLLILVSVLRLYEANFGVIRRKGRLVLAFVAAAALSSSLEVFAWRQPIPMGMTAFLVILAVLWALRAFHPEFMRDLIPYGSGIAAMGGMGQKNPGRDRSDEIVAQARGIVRPVSN